MAEDQNKKSWRAELPEDEDYEEERLRQKWELVQKQKETQREKRFREQKRRLRAIAVLAIAVATLILIFTVLTVDVIIPSIQYRKAVNLLEKGAYSEAIVAFRNMNGYKDSRERMREAIHLQAVELVGKREVLYETTESAPWFSISEDGRLDFSKDSYTGDWHIQIPDVFDGVLVTSLAEKLFIHCTELVSVSVSECVLEIEKSAFFGCTALREIVLPRNLRGIGESAFANCTSLESVTFGDGMERIGASAFAGCKALTSITLPDGLKVLGSRAFNTCSSLREVSLGNVLETLGAYAFSACHALECLSFNGTESEFSVIAPDLNRLGLADTEIIFLTAEG